MKKNLITVLKKTLTAFGGEDTTDNNAVDIIDKIADNINGGGSSSQPLVINFSVREVEVASGQPNQNLDSGPIKYVDIDKSYNEILNAVMAGRKIRFVWPVQTGNTIEVFRVAGQEFDQAGFAHGELGDAMIYAIEELGFPNVISTDLGIGSINGLYATSPDEPMSSEIPPQNIQSQDQTGGLDPDPNWNQQINEGTDHP